MDENEITGAAAEDAADTPADAGRDDEELDREFDGLIRGKYKDAYTRRTQNMINKRFRREKTEQKKREDAAARERAEAALGAAAEYEKIVSDAAALREIYPSFDLGSECRDPKFTRLVAAGIGVRGAYEALHHNEIMAGAMQYAADRVLEAAGRGEAPRPDENGASDASPGSPVRDIASLTERDIRDIIRRVDKGEKIRF